MESAPSPPPQPLSIASGGLRLAGLLFRPSGAPRGALLVCHGAGSRKENHALMGEQAAAAGFAALTFDFRGHGESEGVMGPEGWRDAVAAGETLLAASDAPWLAARGASMGGCFLLLAARARPALFRSLVLLCPADGASLLAGLDETERLENTG
ncbi:MAG TPA: alpha/beta fold hydrolase, partial [Thermoleophilia bacterium]